MKVTNMSNAKSFLLDIIFILLMAELLLGCDVHDCPDSEKVVDHYETTTYGNVTYTEPMMICP